MSLLSAIGGAAEGFLMTGNPIGAAVGGIAGLGGNNISTIGAIGNSGTDATESGYLAATQALNDQNLMFQLQVQQQSQQFDQMTSEKSELMREQNELRDVAMAQKKADDAITKEFIKTIA